MMKLKKVKNIISVILCTAMLAAPIGVLAENDSEQGKYARQALNSDIDLNLNDAPVIDFPMISASPEAIQYAENSETVAAVTASPQASPEASPQSSPEASSEETNEDDLDLSNNYQSFEKVANYISELYIDDTITADDAMLMGVSKLLDGNDEMLWALLKSMFRSLDPWSDFYTAEEYQEFVNSVNKTFFGIGVIIAQNGEYVEIEGFSEENSLAEQSGFKVGDKIAAVNGVDCVGKSLAEVRDLIVGELGTTVDIVVLRDGEEISLVGTRTEVKTATATSAILDGNIGYIKIISFGNETAYDVGTMLDTFHQEGIKNVIFDLRDNGGGVLTSAITIAKMIVPEGKIIDVVSRDNTTTYNSEQKNPEFDIIALVNENTASSAEVLASAIQDSGVGKLVGETTYGKAVFQTAYPLKNGTYFKLTVGKYITRNDRDINYVGLEPDEYVKNTTQSIDSTQFTPFDFTTQNSIGDTGKNIIAAKEKLALLSMYTGSTDDDVFTSDLQSAVIYFQSQNNLCANGVLDIPTQVKIEDRFEELKTTVDRQLIKAYEMFGGNAENLGV